MIIKLFQSSISFVHCFLSIFVGFFIFAISNKCKKPEKIPITIFSKIFNFKLNLDLLILLRKPFEERDEDFEEEKEEIQKNKEEQEKTDW